MKFKVSAICPVNLRIPIKKPPSPATKPDTQSGANISGKLTLTLSKPTILGNSNGRILWKTYPC